MDGIGKMLTVYRFLCAFSVHTSHYMRLDNCAIDYLKISLLGVPITRMGLMTQAIATQVNNIPPFCFY